MTDRPATDHANAPVPPGRCRTCRTRYAQEDGRCRACARLVLGLAPARRWNQPTHRLPPRVGTGVSWWADAQADRTTFMAAAREQARRLRHSPAGQWSSLDKVPVGMSWGRKWAR